MQGSERGGFQMADDFGALARQYWNAWGQAMRSAAPDATVPAQPGWQEAIDWWSRLAQDGAHGDNPTVARFNTQAQQWFGHMQQVAAQFAGQDSNAAEVARAWWHALGAAGGASFLDMIRSLRGQGTQGFEQWLAQAAPLLDMLRGESRSWLRTPGFGFTREHQQRWQALGLALADYQQCTQAYDALMHKATADACGIFESKLAEREEPGRQIASARALFDLWIDAAEDAYAKIALSLEFREVYGRLVNAQMRVRGAVQREVEQVSALFGMPTRSELDGAHRKIAEMERQLRRLRDRLDDEAAPTPPAAAATAAARPAARAPAANTLAAKKAVARPATTGKAAAGRPAAKARAPLPPGKPVASARVATGQASPRKPAAAKRKR